MEVKLSQRRHPSLFLPKFHYSNPLTSPSPFHSCSLKLWLNSKDSFKQHLRVLAERWRFHIQEMSKGQRYTKQYFVHVVKEGETLTSISKQYGVSIHSIVVANGNIFDVDLVFKGQLLNIPTSVPANTQVIKNKGLLSFDQREKSRGSLNILEGFSNPKPFIMLTASPLPYAKPSGYFLVLFPLIAFCIRCIVGAVHTKITKDLGCQVLNESSDHYNKPRRMRWKYALSDISEPDNFDSESRPDSNRTSADEEKNSFEDVSHQYCKLQHDYEKFLSDCGMTERGYWRGGSVE